MLCANTMPRSNNAALQQRESGFNGVRVHVTDGVDAILVTDRLMLCQHSGIMQSLRVALKFIGHNHVNVLRYVFANVLRQGPRLHVLRVEKAQFAAALPDADNDLFLGLGMSGLVLVAMLTRSDEGLIYFNRSAERLRVNGLHRVPDAMAEIPCGAVVDTQHPLELVRRHSLARLTNQERSKKPLDQRKVRVVKHRVCRDGELIAARFVIAVVLIALQDAGYFFSGALRAADAFRPAQPLQIIAAMLLITKSLHQFAEVNSFCHKDSPCHARS